MKGVRFLQGGISVKKVIFILLAVILVVSSGVQIQAAELPFVPDGEKNTSEVKEDKKETTEETSQTLTLNGTSYLSIKTIKISNFS